MKSVLLLCLLLLCGCGASKATLPCPKPQQTLLKKQKLAKPLKPVKQAPKWVY